MAGGSVRCLHSRAASILTWYSAARCSIVWTGVLGVAVGGGLHGVMDLFVRVRPGGAILVPPPPHGKA
jgi:hypothetical protein